MNNKNIQYQNLIKITLYLFSTNRIQSKNNASNTHIHIKGLKENIKTK